MTAGGATPDSASASGDTGYRPISDYALIGDCHGSALVSREGSVDWCCLGRFDADPVFCSLLDAEKGGTFSLAPAGEFRSERAYFDETNILTTAFTTSSGQVSVRDFMPVGRRPGNGIHDYVRLNAPHWLVRVVEGMSGTVEMRMRFRPSADFARTPVKLSSTDGRVLASSGATLHHDLPDVSVRGDVAEAVFRVGAGQRVCFVCAASPAEGDPLARVDELGSVTRSFWEEWISYCRYRGPHGDTVRRSALTLKMLTYAPTGAIVAAPTTSLPEEIGGNRNWDYRCCWLRDSVLALYALAVIGYGGEAACFSAFLAEASKGNAPDLQIMYGIDGRSDLTETELGHLAGYRGSRPVRTGNAAFRQRQMDVFGELLDWADIYLTIGGHLDQPAREMLAGLADFVAEHWREPDQSIWEIRGPARHHVHSKIMSWVTLDRAIRRIGRRAQWEEARDAITAEIRADGFAPDGHMRQSYGEDGVDAAALVAPMLGFSLTPEQLKATIAAVEERLRSGDFVHRYCTADGLVGDEGAFLICSFWLIDALLLADRADEAGELFDRMCKYANDVGLYPEEVDPATGVFLGNFPQAFTHLALIASAGHLHLHRRSGRRALEGTYACRAKRLVGATLGWRGIRSAMKMTRRLGRLRSSKASVLDV